MAVKIRLMRLGKKKQPVYRVVVADGRKPRDGRYIESLGRYDAREEPSLVEIDNDKAVGWLNNGAQPTEAARKLLEISGAWSQYKISRGEIHTVAPKSAAPAAEEAAPEVAEEPTPEAAESDADEASADVASGDVAIAEEASGDEANGEEE